MLDEIQLSDLAIHRYENGKWTPLETFIDERTQTLTARTKQLGLFQIRHGRGHINTMDGYASLDQNFPNPFNGETRIQYRLKESGRVVLEIRNSRGQLVRTLIDQWTSAGNHQLTWDGRNSSGQVVASGVYFYRLVTENAVITRKMLLIK